MRPCERVCVCVCTREGVGGVGVGEIEVGGSLGGCKRSPGRMGSRQLPAAARTAEEAGQLAAATLGWDALAPRLPAGRAAPTCWEDPVGRRPRRLLQGLQASQARPLGGLGARQAGPGQQAGGDGLAGRRHRCAARTSERSAPQRLQLSDRQVTSSTAPSRHNCTSLCLRLQTAQLHSQCVSASNVNGGGQRCCGAEGLPCTTPPRRWAQAAARQTPPQKLPPVPSRTCMGSRNKRKKTG